MEAAPNSTEVELQQRDPQPVVSIRAIIPVAQLGETVGERLEALGAYLHQHGIAPAGPPFVRYHTFAEIETDMEVGFPLVAPLAGEGHITAGKLPGGPNITTWHYGPHIQLGDAYTRLTAWLAAHTRTPNGPAWEVYHWIDLSPNHDPVPDQDPTIAGTQLVQPIK
jgi:effector-binding domain-containing protein